MRRSRGNGSWPRAIACGALLLAGLAAPGALVAQDLGGQTHAEIRYWSDPAAGPACDAAAVVAASDGPFSPAVTCRPVVERSLARARARLVEVHDVGAFAESLADAATAARGGGAVRGRDCTVRRLACGQSAPVDLGASACVSPDGLALELFELPLVAGQSLRLELHGAATDAQVALADPALLLRDSAFAQGGALALERELEQTGRWGVAVTAAADATVPYRLDVSCDGLAVGAAPPNGTYTGTHSDVGDMSLEVLNNTIQSFEFENFGCPFGFVTKTGATFTPGCAIAANGTFSCGTVGCAAFTVNARVQGQFSGSTVSGNFTFNQKPDAVTTCCDRNLIFNATLEGGGQTAPTAPSSLAATATSSTSVTLTWQDNSNNEDDFRIEAREGASGDFLEVGTAAANATSALVQGLDPGTPYSFRLRARNAAGFSDFSNIASATTPSGGGATNCVLSSTRLCLQQDRFAVEVGFRTTAGGPSQQAQGYEETSDSGLFFFFQQSNLEKLIKVLNGCALNGRYWVFFAATTDVEFTVTVTDTQNGQVRTYFNPLGQAANAITDTNAFATCP